MLVRAGAGVLSVGLSMSGGRWHVCEGHRSVVWGILACVGDTGVCGKCWRVVCRDTGVLCEGYFDVCVEVAALLWGALMCV